jgi:hypothetical protein
LVRIAATARAVSAAVKASQSNAKGVRKIRVAVVFQVIDMPPAFAENGCFRVKVVIGFRPMAGI